MQAGSDGVVYALGAVLFGAIATVTLRRRAANPVVAWTLAVIMLGAAWWYVALAVVAAAADPVIVAIATIALYPGPSLMVGAFVCFGISVVRPQWVPSRTVIGLLLLEPAVTTVAAAVYGVRLLVDGDGPSDRLTGAPGWTDGSLFGWHVAYGYVGIVIGLGLIMVGWYRAERVFRRQYVAMLLAATIPSVVNAVYLAGGFGDGIDPTPFGFALTATLTWFAIFRQNLIDFRPVARSLVIEQIDDAVVVLSPVGRVLDLNPTAERLVRRMLPDLGEAIVGRPATEVFAHVRSRDAARSDVVVTFLDGATAEFHVRSSTLAARHHGTLGTVFVGRDVTQQNAWATELAAANVRLSKQVSTIERLRADVAELAVRDPLTGLHNRRHLVEHFERLAGEATRSGTPFVVVLADVDRFKRINDKHGHLVGDSVLIALAQTLREASPSGALLARWGGEEFFLALPGLDAAAGVAFADALRTLCALNGVDVAGTTVRCTLSLGVAAFPESGTTMRALFGAADQALYAAKRAGRNTVRLAGPDGLTRDDAATVDDGVAAER